MKRTTAVFLASLILLSCPGPLDRDRLEEATVQIGLSLPSSGAVRTLVPNFPSFVKKMKATFTSTSGLPQVSGTDEAAPYEFTVAQGTWKIDVEVMNDSNEKIGSGTLDNFEVKSGGALTAAVPITFSPKPDQKGTVAFKVSVPDSTGVDYVQGRLMKAPESIDEATLTLSGEKKTGELNFSDLDDGIYTLVLTFKRGAAIAGVFREKIVAVGGYESASWVTANGDLADERAFTAAEFLEVPCFNLTFTGGVPSATMLPSVASFDVGTVNGLPAAITFTATGISAGLTLRYRWNKGAFNSIVSGQASGALDTGDCNELEIEATKSGTTTYHRVTFSKPLTNGNTYSFPGSGGAVTMSINSDETVTISSSGSVITSVDIPSYIGGHKVTTIGTNAFKYRYNLASVTIPSSVTSIGANAFDSTALTSVTIPDSVTSIGNDAFTMCTSLTSVSISNKVTAIPVGAFFNCSGLTSVTIPALVTSIGRMAFRDCSKLSSVHILAAEPQALDSTAFTNNASTLKFYISNDYKTAYRNVAEWKAFDDAGAIVWQ